MLAPTIAFVTHLAFDKRSLKYECVYLKEFDTGHVARDEIGEWVRDYNWDRPHSFLPDDKTPMEVYNERIAA